MDQLHFLNQKVTIMTTEQNEKIVELMGLCKLTNCFLFENTLFLGNHSEIVEQYVMEQSSDKFFIWLQKNIIMLKPL